MTEGLHNPKPIQDDLEPHAKRLGDKNVCGSCGRSPGPDTLDDEDVTLDLYVLPVSNSVHATPQLTPLCTMCAMEIAEALGELSER